MQVFQGGSIRKKPTEKKRPKPFARLAIDTSFTRHRGETPKEVFPSKSRTQDLVFFSAEEAKARIIARKNSHEQHISKIRLNRSELERQGFETSVVDGSSPYVSEKDNHATVAPLAAPAFHKRIDKLRPSPLELNKDVSPSDRAITIGIALSPEAVPRTNLIQPDQDDQSAAQTGSRQIYVPRYGNEATTPIIVVTPARDSFSLSPGGSKEFLGYRPTSSVYSRYTNYMPKLETHERAPPVPPLPLYKNVSTGKGQIVMLPRHSMTTTFENRASPCQYSDKTHSACTAFEEDDVLTPLPREIKVQTPGLPTPRRSKGWWNVLTSPFSAKSGSFLAKSPSIDEEESDRTPMLRSASPMATGPHTGVILLDRASDDDELRSAPAGKAESLPGPRVPRRSGTAPGALDRHGRPDFSIYRIPSQGEAASYFDINRSFPSVHLQKDEAARIFEEIPDGWSPSHSVYIEPTKRTVIHEVSGEPREVPDVMQIEDDVPSEKAEDVPMIREVRPEQENKDASAPFSTPASEEMSTPATDARAPPVRTFTQATATDSLMSPLSATPVLQHAHMATFVGPRSSHGGQPREIDVIPGRSPLPAESIVLGSDPPTHAMPRTMHARQDSSGLGIKEEQRPMRPPTLPPPPPESDVAHLVRSEKMVTSKDLDERDRIPRVPFYRRFFWPLVALGAGLLALVVILLVIFVHQGHASTPVQASWLKTTGFPGLATGVSTVIAPELSASEDNCVPLSTQWSCMNGSNATNTQPNFRFEIFFRNGTLPANETRLQQRRWMTSRISRGMSQQDLVKRSACADLLYSAVPQPPSQNDQVFLGQTTDNNSAPYDGDETPFFISLLDPAALVASDSHLQRRDSGPSFRYPYPESAGNNDSRALGKNASTTGPASIPAAALQQNGQVALPVLYPFVVAQPLRLFNRGQDSEHYGFYTYFDRVHYVQPASSANVTGATGSSSSSSNTASHGDNSTEVIFYSQTRFLIQIWTRRGSVNTLPGLAEGAAAKPSPAANSSANDMTSPGSFPYPVSITIDRRGGQADKKGVYAYALNAGMGVVASRKAWIDEDRGAGLINPAQVPHSNGTSLLSTRGGGDAESIGYGGVDGGGQGGCLCRWTTST